jgi:prepilin peptidase CpaA
VSQEFIAVIELLKTLFLDPRTGVLIALLVVAAGIDARSNRIPNWLVFGGTAFGIAYNALFPGFPQGMGSLAALGGLGVGLGALLPFYLLRSMGAGDVKLMAMAGAFLGPWDTFCAVLATFLAGGAMSIAFALWSGALVRTLQNLVSVFRGAALDLALGSKPVLIADEGVSVGKLPYGVAIAVGTIGCLVLKQFGYV